MEVVHASLQQQRIPQKRDHAEGVWQGPYTTEECRQEAPDDPVDYVDHECQLQALVLLHIFAHPVHYRAVQLLFYATAQSLRDDDALLEISTTEKLTTAEGVALTSQ